MVRKKKSRKKRNRYVGKLPVNARITIDYANKKPKVKFGYPRKDKAYQVIFTLPTFIPAILMSCLLLILFQTITDDLGAAVPYPEMDDCKSYLIHPINETYATGLHLECTIEGKLHVMKTKFDRGGKFTYFENKPELLTDREVALIKFDAEGILGVIALIILGLTFPFFIWLMYLFYTRTKFGQRIFPEIGKALDDARYYAKFDKVPANKQIEIPLFKNIYLDYKATKGFSKNLLKMDIMEHPFTEIVRKGNSPFSLKKRMEKITKTKKQVYLWKAVFYFKDIPKDGQLEMWWT